jgi:hypothetical protein
MKNSVVFATYFDISYTDMFFIIMPNFIVLKYFNVKYGIYHFVLMHCTFNFLAVWFEMNDSTQIWIEME